jgi:hypothetical protein
MPGKTGGGKKRKQNDCRWMDFRIFQLETKEVKCKDNKKSQSKISVF